MSALYFFAPNTLQLPNEEAYKSFTLVPIQDNVPFIQGMYDPTGKSLVLLSPHQRQHFDMLTQFDSKGFPKIIKGPNNEQMYAKKLTEFSQNHEVSISNEKSIRAFVKAFCNLSLEEEEYLNEVLNPEELKPKVLKAVKDEDETSEK